MRTIVAKIDDETFEQLEKLSGGRQRSDTVRSAIKHYIAAQRIKARRREVEEYMRSRSSDEAKLTRDLAEADMDEAARLLARVENET